MKKNRIVLAAALSAGAALVMTACGTGGAETDGASARTSPSVAATAGHSAHEGGKSAHEGGKSSDGAKEEITTKDGASVFDAAQSVIDRAREDSESAPHPSMDGWWFYQDTGWGGHFGMQDAGVAVNALPPEGVSGPAANDWTSSLVNQSSVPLCVYSDNDFQGTSHYFAPGAVVRDLSVFGLNDTISSFRASPDPANETC
ncbi:hypothetical protein KUM39_04740 [Streptomyces sp. J2-1]|uniref:peptidase inhibitor family I36 protein n=1 Tax=Streptomyces corallincola TaxID=2851888 RepID=UPI001C37EE0F|nr:peptidase inhibitor family I36 protein [Streptomyces corallincola]MBV2353674.1 hypothetical protein [Streptomyces corallincola]